jgi:Secretion system C-terminal sorting domain
MEKTLPYVVLKNHNMDVSVLLPNYGDIKIRIYDIEGKKVREDVFTNAFQLHKRYDLSKLASGIYFAEISVGEETETFTLKL